MSPAACSLPRPALVSPQSSSVALSVASASQVLTTESASGSPAATSAAVPVGSITEGAPCAAMSVLFASAAVASAVSAVRAGQPAFARASFTSVRTVSDESVLGAGAAEDDDGAEDEGGAEDDEEGDDGDDEVEPGTDEELDEDADDVPAGPVEPGRVRGLLVPSVTDAVPVGWPVTAPARATGAFVEATAARCCREAGASATGRPSSPSTTGESPSAEFEDELSSDTGAREPESTGTASAITATTPATIPTSTAGITRRARKDDADREGQTQRRSAARIRADSGGAEGTWCTGRRSETVEIDVVTLARLAVCAA